MNFVKTLCMDHFSRKLSIANLYKNHKLLKIIVTVAVPNVHPVICQTNNQDHVNNGLLVEQEYVHFNAQWILSKPLIHDQFKWYPMPFQKSVILWPGVKYRLSLNMKWMSCSEGESKLLNLFVVFHLLFQFVPLLMFSLPSLFFSSFSASSSLFFFLRR